jgi:concanavalin A-like lectin/glucanase superfamily protein
MRFVSGVVLLLCAAAQAGIIDRGLILDMDADKGVEVEDGDRVVKWTNQIMSFAARDFVKRDKGRAEAGSGRPTLKRSVAAIGGHDTLVFRRQELLNHHEDAFDHLLTGHGYTWLVVMCVYEQVVQLKDVNSIFGNLRTGGNYEGIWGNLTDDNRVWIGSRNGITFGRWDENNPMVTAPKPLKERQYYVVAGRMGAGTGTVQIEVFINAPEPVVSSPFPVNPKANASKMAIGQERDATNHPGKESFDGEITRFLIYERPLTNAELKQTLTQLKKMYTIQ